MSKTRKYGKIQIYNLCEVKFYERKRFKFKIDRKFPELKEKYDEEVNWQEGDNTGSHVVYGDVFTPFIRKKLEEKDNRKLEKIFEFIEKLLETNDDYIENVLSVSVIESIIYDDTDLIKKYAKEKTLNIIKNFIEYDNSKKH